MMWMPWVMAIQTTIFALFGLFDGDVSNISLLSAQQRECCADLWATDALLPKSCTLQGARQCWALSVGTAYTHTTMRRGPAVATKPSGLGDAKGGHHHAVRVYIGQLPRPEPEGPSWWREFPFVVWRIARKAFISMPLRFRVLFLLLICKVTRDIVEGVRQRQGGWFRITLWKAGLLTAIFSIVKMYSELLNRNVSTRYLDRPPLPEASAVFDEFDVWKALAGGLAVHVLIFLPLQRYFRPSERIATIIWCYAFFAFALPQVLLWSDLLSLEAFASCFTLVLAFGIALSACWEFLNDIGYRPVDLFEDEAA